MFVYANLPIGWTELPDDTLINNVSLIEFYNIMLNNDINNPFVEVKFSNNDLYLIHVSQIQLFKKI